jgi:hypothetical protein
VSVENFDQLDGAMAFLDGDAPEDCFHCWKPLAGLTVYWHNGTGGIALHPDCAVALGARLCRDGLNAKLIGEGKTPAGVGVGLVSQNTS